LIKPMSIDKKLALSLPEFFLSILFAPSTAFRMIKNCKHSKEIIIYFMAGFVVVFAKSFQSSRVNSNFFVEHWQNDILSLLSDPQLSVVIQYVAFFLLVCIIFAISKFFNKDANIKVLVLSLMSISAVAIPCHIAFFILKFILPSYLILNSEHLVNLWVIVISIKSTSIALDISTLKATISFASPLLVTFILVAWLPMAPYLIFLSR